MKHMSSRCIGTTLLFMLGTLIGLLIGTAGADISPKHMILTVVVTIVFYATQKFSLTSFKILK
jgi:hypothetical protein